MRNRKTYSLGIIGHPLRHSLSPQIHRAALTATGLRGDYHLYPVPPLPDGKGVMAGYINQMKSGELQGLNVTMPHKQAVIPFLDDLTPTARSIGAVNTIFRYKEKLFGENTDGKGFLVDMGRLIESEPKLLEGGQRFALVLGAGGSARAVTYSLASNGWTVNVAARRIQQAKELAASINKVIFDTHFVVKACHLSKNNLTFEPSPSLIVNTTPLGMAPNTFSSPWPEGLPFPIGAVVYDLVYNPIETAFVRAANNAGLKAKSGLGMLIEQAALSFECWTGIKPAIEILRNSIISEVEGTQT